MLISLLIHFRNLEGDNEIVIILILCKKTFSIIENLFAVQRLFYFGFTFHSGYKQLANVIGFQVCMYVCIIRTEIMTLTDTINYTWS